MPLRYLCSQWTKATLTRSRTVARTADRTAS